MQPKTTTTNNTPSEIKEKTANDLIPELILKINNYSSKLKDRVKIYSIFREFDSYAHMNLQNFIKMSDKRYRSIKSGNNLRNILLKQKKECNELSTKILSNNLYNDKNIEKEEKKLYRKINNKDSKELYKIRHEIIEKTKDLTEKEVERREKYLISAQKSRNLKEKKLKNQKKEIQSNKSNIRVSVDSYNKNKFTNLNFNRTFINKKSKSYNDMNIVNSNLINNDMSKTVVVNRLSQEKEYLKAKKEFLDNLVKKDNQNLNDNFTDYKQFLKDIENSKNDNFSRIINDGNNFGHTYSFKINDIKLLSFQEEKEQVTQIKNKENPEVEIAKLVKYTKRGNRKWFLNNIKERSKERQNSFKTKLKFRKIEYKLPKKHKVNSAIVSKSPNDNNIFRKINDNSLLEFANKGKEFSTVDSMGRTGSTTFSNFRNTIKTVKNEAKMIQNIGKNFLDKRKTMEGFFKRFNLPEIKEYDQMFKTRINFNIQQKNKNKKKANEENSTNKINALSKKSLKLNQNLSQKNAKDELINAKIFADMQKTYDSKKKIWAKEDLKKERIKKEKLEHIEQTKKYLEEMAHFKRTPHLFVDPYSKRDDLINNRIKLFTRSLSGPFYSKKKIESRIDDFNNYIEQKEIEKKINDEKLAETLKEEQLKIREDDLEFQTKQKMKLNFAKEALNEDANKDNDIKLNYKFIATLKATKKKNKNKSYKDYQEFLDIVKDKQKRGLYDIYLEKDLNQY